MTRRARVAEELFGLQVDPRQRAARLAAGLYALGALRLLVSAPLLPDLDRTALLALSALLAVSVLPALALPWQRMPRWSVVVPLLWAVVLLTALGAWAGGLGHFVGFYGLTSVYVGVSQRPGTWRWLAPVYGLSVGLALLGNEPRSGAVDVAGAAALSVVVGEVLAHAVSRTREANRGALALLDAVTSLQQTSSELEAADLVADLAHGLLAPDVVVVLVASHPGSRLYVNRGQRGIDAPLGSLVVDAGARSGVRLAFAEERAVFVAEADHSPLLAQSVLARLGVASVLFVPVPGEGGYLGCVVVGWNTPLTTLDSFGERVVSLLSDQAGGLLERLRRVGVLQHQARTDALTGLANRRAFLDALDRLRPGGAVVFLDLDHFKRLNDSLGHQAGDVVLSSFAKALRTSVRDGDCAARYGGEEFALVLPGPGSVDMAQAAQAVVDRLREAWDGPVTFSVGIAVHRTGDAPSTTLARADAAVYEAKASGRNTLVFA
ncbi:MAG: diguanylate cyclase domain-containing protein [Mycobacteriales bacterium]